MNMVELDSYQDLLKKNLGKGVIDDQINYASPRNNNYIFERIFAKR